MFLIKFFEVMMFHGNKKAPAVRGFKVRFNSMICKLDYKGFKLSDTVC